VAAAFAAGPSILVIVLQVIAAFTDYKVPEKAFMTLRNIIRVAMAASLFLLASEAFTEFYTDSAHVASARYLFLGLEGHNALVPWIWTAIALNSTALVILFTPASRSKKLLNVACGMIIVGVWIEKGMGLVIPAFVPTPLGEIVEYTPDAQRVARLGGDRRVRALDLHDPGPRHHPGPFRPPELRQALRRGRPRPSAEGRACSEPRHARCTLNRTSRRSLPQ
jgi:hypothetical protein